MVNKKIILIFICLFSFSLFSFSQAETLTFGSSIYEGEVKKGMAYGEGILTFSDDTKYKGKFNKNKIHGKGSYTDARENVHEGKWSYGKLRVKLDKKTRKIIKLSVKEEAPTIYHEIRGTGKVIGQWFEALQDSSGVFKLTNKGKRDMAKKIEEAGERSDGWQ